MGNKAEITNLIGRKGSKMTMQSNVKTKRQNRLKRITTV